VACLVKAALATPAYLSVAWALMVSYQIFTETSVKTVVDALGVYFPQVGGWLILRMDMIVFIYAFAWVFVLSSIIPQLILGKERSVLIQFIVCLALTMLGLILVDVIKGYGFDLTKPEVLLSNQYTQLFGNIIFAAFYLSLPYIFMVTIDYRSRSAKKRKGSERLKKLTDAFAEAKAEGKPA
jgi:hypothetical protein